MRKCTHLFGKVSMKAICVKYKKGIFDKSLVQARYEINE